MLSLPSQKGYTAHRTIRELSAENLSLAFEIQTEFIKRLTKLRNTLGCYSFSDYFKITRP